MKIIVEGNGMSDGITRRAVLAGGITIGAGVVVGTAVVATKTAETTGPGSTSAVTLRVNGSEQRLDIDTRASLLDTLRDQVELTGAKKGCNQGVAGPTRCCSTAGRCWAA